MGCNNYDISHDNYLFHSVKMLNSLNKSKTKIRTLLLEMMIVDERNVL